MLSQVNFLPQKIVYKVQSSVQDIWEVVLTVLFKAEVFNNERNILPFLLSNPAVARLQGKVAYG